MLECPTSFSGLWTCVFLLHRKVCVHGRLFGWPGWMSGDVFNAAAPLLVAHNNIYLDLVKHVSIPIIIAPERRAASIFEWVFTFSLLIRLLLLLFISCASFSFLRFFSIPF